MKLNEKIRKIRKDKGISLQALERRLKGIFGKKALRYNTLFRIEKGLRDGRDSSLSQICLGLGISLKELTAGTSEEKAITAIVINKKNQPIDYIYNEKAQAQIISGGSQNYFAQRLLLAAGGQTKPERGPQEHGKAEKWIYCLKGTITLYIGNERLALRKDEVAFFDSATPHYFANLTTKKSACIIIQKPK